MLNLVSVSQLPCSVKNVGAVTHISRFACAAPRFPETVEKALGIRTVHLETLIGAAVLGRRPHIVKPAAGIERRGIEFQTTPNPGQRATVQDAGE
jgi:hypothetical protein